MTTVNKKQFLANLVLQIILLGKSFVERSNLALCVGPVGTRDGIYPCLKVLVCQTYIHKLT